MSVTVTHVMVHRIKTGSSKTSRGETAPATVVEIAVEIDMGHFAKYPAVFTLQNRCSLLMGT